MKKAIIYFFIVFISACKEEIKREKPQKLLTPTQMKNLIIDMSFFEPYEVMYLSSIQNTDNRTKADFYEFIYKKYGVNDTIIKQNNDYYAQDMEQYKNIYKVALDSINILKEIYRPNTKE